MFLIEQDSLTPDKLLSLLQEFNTTDRVKLNRYNDYYMGKQAISKKPSFDEKLDKPCNRITTNFCKNIVDNYQGYLTGLDVTYSSDSDITQVQDVLNYNDVSQEDSELLKQALIYGVGYEICYIDSDSKQRFAVLDSREVFPIYYNTLDNELAAVVRYYLIDNTDISKGYYVEVYTNESITTYTCSSGWSNLIEVEQVDNNYNQIPITVFDLNKEQVSIFDCIMSLQDAYNTLLSAEVDDFEAFCDAYLILKGINTQGMQPEDWAAMRKSRILDVGDNGDASYLTKSVSDTQIENMLTNIKDNIHKISACPDFADSAFGTASGAAMRYKLLGFENRSGAIVKSMTKALQKRIELICSIIYKVEGAGNELWRDVQITFTRNLPTDMADIANTVNSFRGLVSDKTLLAQIPFVQDVDTELKALEEQQAANMELYGFGKNTPTEDEE